MVIISNPIINTNTYNAVISIKNSGLLHKFYTTFFWNRDNKINFFLPHFIKKEFLRRSFLDIEDEYVKMTYPFWEIFCVFLNRLGYNNRLFKNTLYAFHDKYVASCLTSGVKAVFGYPFSTFHTFKVAKKKGIKCVYEDTHGYIEKLKILMEEEFEPFWGRAYIKYKRELFSYTDKYKEELELADLVIVPSKFAYDTLSLSKIDLNKVKIIPYGAPVCYLPDNFFSCQRIYNKLRVIFVGELTPRKGISYLLKALEGLEDKVEFTIVGLKPRYFSPILDKYLKKYTYIPTISNYRLLELMRKNDVLVLSSLFDVFGLVVLEAMSQGLTVIVSENVGASEIIENNHDGFIVPIRSVEKIREKIDLLYQDRGLLYKMRHNAYKKSLEFTWDKYQLNIIKELKKICNIK